MTLIETSALTSKLVCITLLMQTLEILSLSKGASFFHIWSYNNLKANLEIGLPLKNSTIQKLFSPSMFKVLIILQIVLSFFGFFYPTLPVFLGLTFIHLYICLWFRGTFNGGSDMMMFVVLSGVLIGLIGASEFAIKIGFIYITINTLYSYFKSGFSKVKRQEWLVGNALPIFLNRSPFQDIKLLSIWLDQRPALCLVLCWGVITFETLAAIIIIIPNWAYYYFVAAMTFHFFNYIVFGLNRFFWIWLCAWPATIFSLSLLTAK